MDQGRRYHLLRWSNHAPHLPTISQPIHKYRCRKIHFKNWTGDKEGGIGHQDKEGSDVVVVVGSRLAAAPGCIIILWCHHRNVRVNDELVQVIVLIGLVILSDRTGKKCVHTLSSFLTVILSLCGELKPSHRLLYFGRFRKLTYIHQHNIEADNFALPDVIHRHWNVKW